MKNIWVQSKDKKPRPMTRAEVSITNCCGIDQSSHKRKRICSYYLTPFHKITTRAPTLSRALSYQGALTPMSGLDLYEGRDGTVLEHGRC